MSTWICKAILLPLLLSGCVIPNSNSGLPPQANVPQTLTVSGVKLAGPQGYCPIQNSQQQVAGAGFIAFAPCDGSAGLILSATIGAENSAEGITLTKARMEPYFKTPQGIAALRGAGNHDGIALHEVQDIKGAVVLRITREAPEGKSDAWRALMQVDGRLVTLAVRPRQGKSLNQTDGKRSITEFIDAMRGASR